MEVAGVDALEDPRAVRRLLGYVALEVAFDKILSGRELLQLQGDLYHLGRSDRNRRIDDLIDRLAMAEWIDRRCGTYSEGCGGGLISPPVCCIVRGCWCSMSRPSVSTSRAVQRFRAAPPAGCGWNQRAPEQPLPGGGGSSGR